MKLRGQQLFSLVLFLGLAVCTPAHASDYTDKADKAQDLREELAVKKAEHAALLQKSSALSSEVGNLKKNLVKVSKDLRASEESLSETDQNLKNLRDRKEEVIETLYKDQRAMGGFVSAVKKYSQTSTPNMLMQSNPIDAARASIVMKSVMPRLQQQSTILKDQLSEIKKIEDDIANQLKVQTDQNKKLNRQQDDLAGLLQERKKLYASTESERQAQEKEVARLTKESRNLDELLSKLKSKPKKRAPRQDADVAEDDGPDLPFQMMMPVHGKVHTAFGQPDDLGAPSKGISFSTRPGASVTVPLGGVVKFAGAFQKYKQILIVEHKGGYHSLIAGLARIDTVVGASLAAGEPVGVAEASDDPRIYYELRRNGKPINPKKSLLAQKK